MKLEHQVVSLDLARRLKALGVKQESYFVWTQTEITDKWVLTRDMALARSEVEGYRG